MLGAMVLGAATSSARSGALSSATAKPALPPIAAEVATAQPVTLLGFAPPPVKPAEALPGITAGTAAPQFRISSDLPTGPLGIPGVVLQAYKLAESRMASEEPQCRLPWFLLAGIGRIESNHASNGSVDQFGNTINPIEGPVLDGSLAGNEVIRHSNGGFARAMGPMQFIPGTWAAWGADANGDGKSDPNNVFDATYAAGRYLCAGVHDIMTDGNKTAAVFRYNHSMEYVANVLSWAAAYATGVMPTNPIPEPKQVDKSSSSSSSKPAKPGESSETSSSESSSSESASESSTPSKPTQQCIAGICLPPGMTVPGLMPPPAPKPAPGRVAPQRAPTTTPVPVG